MKYWSSSGVGIDAEQACRATTSAPQAFAIRAASRQLALLSQPLRSPAMNASPAPRTFITLTGKPGTTCSSSMRDGTSPSNTAEPRAPSFTASTAGVSARTARRESTRSSRPPAMRNSSSVPTTTSKRGSICCKWAVTRSLRTNRCSPAAGCVSPQSTGR